MTRHKDPWEVSFDLTKSLSVRMAPRKKEETIPGWHYKEGRGWEPIDESENVGRREDAKFPSAQMDGYDDEINCYVTEAILGFAVMLGDIRKGAKAIDDGAGGDSDGSSGSAGHSPSGVNGIVKEEEEEGEEDLEKPSGKSMRDAGGRGRPGSPARFAWLRDLVKRPPKAEEIPGWCYSSERGWFEKGKEGERKQASQGGQGGQGGHAQTHSDPRDQARAHPQAHAHEGPQHEPSSQGLLKQREEKLLEARKRAEREKEAEALALEEEEEAAEYEKVRRRQEQRFGAAGGGGRSKSPKGRSPGGSPGPRGPRGSRGRLSSGGSDGDLANGGPIEVELDTTGRPIYEGKELDVSDRDLIAEIVAASLRLKLKHQSTEVVQEIDVETESESVETARRRSSGSRTASGSRGSGGSKSGSGSSMGSSKASLSSRDRSKSPRAGPSSTTAPNPTAGVLEKPRRPSPRPKRDGSPRTGGAGIARQITRTESGKRSGSPRARDGGPGFDI